MPEVRDIVQPPKYCGYAGGPCDQNIKLSDMSDGLLLYPSKPEIIASTIEEFVSRFSETFAGQKWNTWKDLGVVGKITFCEIYKRQLDSLN